MNGFFLYLTLVCLFGATGLWLLYFLAQRQGYYRAGAWVMAGAWRAITWPSSSGSGSPGPCPPPPSEKPAVIRLGLVAAFLVLIWRYPIKILGPWWRAGGLMVSGTLILPRGQGPSLPCSKVSGSPCTSA